MKNLLLLITLSLLSLTGNAQNIHLMDERLKIVEKNQQQIILNIDRSDKEFRTGNYFLCWGLGIGALATFTYFKGEGGLKHHEHGTSRGMYILSSVLLCTGITLQIDSHKHFNRGKKYNQ